MLYALGSNGSGQLGIGDTDDRLEPALCRISWDDGRRPGTWSRPARICAGGNHTLLLLEDGRLFSAGFNNDVRAGNGSEKSRSGSVDSPTIFTPVSLYPEDLRFKLCSATWEASILVTTEDQVLSFGSGHHGELGIGSEKSPKPQRFDNFPPPETSIVEIASSVGHTVVILSNGDVYGWGNGRKGQLGNPRDIVLFPRKLVDIEFKAFHATCGREFTCIAGEPSQGDFMVLGSDKWRVRSDAPHDIRGWKKIGSSWGSITVLTTTGELLGWGRNDRGQLPPKDLPADEIIEQIAVGSEHTLALTESGRVRAWGWGEHGNCGPNFDQNGNKWSARPFLTASPSTDAFLGAGCATSFIWTLQASKAYDGPLSRTDLEASTGYY